MNQDFTLDLQEEIKILFEAFVDSVRFLEPQSYNGLVIVPLTSDFIRDKTYLLLEEALETGKFQVKEVSESGTVSELKVINKLDREVLLLEGDILVGAKQNRTVNTTIIVGRGKELIIPVSCVEEGRWSYKSVLFRTSDFVLDADLRKEKVKTVTESLKRKKIFKSDQHLLWQKIKEKMLFCECHSLTDDLEELYKKESSKIDEELKLFKIVEGQTGFAVFIQDVLVSLEMFGVRGILEKKFNKLIKSYLMEARSGETSKRRKSLREVNYEEKIQDILKLVKSSKKEIHKSVGEGYDIRFDEKFVTGFAVEHNGKIVHLVGFTV